MSMIWKHVAIEFVNRPASLVTPASLLSLPTATDLIAGDNDYRTGT